MRRERRKPWERSHRIRAILAGVLGAATFVGVAVATHATDVNSDDQIAATDFGALKNQWWPGTVVAAPTAIAARPNPARFYSREQKASWDRLWDASTKSRIAKYNDLIFIDAPLEDAKRIKNDIRALASAQGNAHIKLLRHWNMWGAFHPEEANYTHDMYLYDTWPASTGIRLAHRVRNSCVWPDLVDISRADLKAEVARVINVFRSEFDGVMIDVSSWRTYLYRGHGLKTGGCPPPSPTSGYATGFRPRSKEFAVEYHRFLQDNAIDPAHTNAKLHLCNDIPQRAQDRDTPYEDKYLSTLDGCQIDTAFVHQNGWKFTQDDWKFQLDTMRKFAANNRYFLAKMFFGDIRGAPDAGLTDRFEYGFASYLLGTDGKFALFARFGHAKWDTDPLYTAPLGNFAGDYQQAPGASYTYFRDFENGRVYVNADTASHSVTLPSGTYRDVLRNTTYSGTITVPAQSGRVLVKVG